MVDSGTPSVRVNDADRQATVDRLREAVGAGYLELEEFSDRVEQALLAVDRDALTLVTRDLPLAATTTQPRRRTFILGVMGGGNRQGSWHVSERVAVVNIMGGADLDLRSALISAPVTTITVLSIMGGSTITVPDGIEVDLHGFALMGGNKLKLNGARPPASAPRLVVRAYSMMGGTRVRSERPRRRDQRA